MPKPTHTISVRAERFWARLQDWYGTKLGEMFGPAPSEDLCKLIDRSDNDAIVRALQLIKAEHPDFPPTFPQIERFIRPAQQSQRKGPTVQEELCEYAVNHYFSKITKLQFSMPWRYIYRERQSFDSKGSEIVAPECIAVEIPQRDGICGYRISVDDMRSAAP